MTNNWVDIGNTSLVYIQGANPSENHPACMAHVNNARYDGWNRGRKAQMIVVDPRITRTARQINTTTDRFVRIRPGTDIAFINSVMNKIYELMYAARVDGPSNPLNAIALNFFTFHNNQTASRAFINDAGGTTTLTWPKYVDSRVRVSDASGVDGTYSDYLRGTTSGISNFPQLAADVEATDTVFQKMRSHVAKYPSVTAAAICGCTAADIDFVADALLRNSRFASNDFGETWANPSSAGYRATAFLYAMGITQHTYGSQNVRSYGVIQSFLGNMGRPGGGIQALRGIHNVQGSTDMALLFDGIPGYSGNPGTATSYTAYSNALFGNRVTGTGAKNPYKLSELGLQQEGFFNMTREWFGSRDIAGSWDPSGNFMDASGEFEKLYACWPKGNGYQHIEVFRRMATKDASGNSTDIKAAVVWGQNPAITEPNQGAVRAGLKQLDTLVCVDMFANETAQVSRKAGGVTYLLPACSHVEEAGSVTNSGRWIQWRDRAALPQGRSKADVELLLRFAKALNGVGAFNHIKTQWAGTALAGKDAYDVLYSKYGWDPDDGAFNDASGVDSEGAPLTDSEYVAEQIFKEIASPMNATTGPMGTVWIYSGNGSSAGYVTTLGNNNPRVWNILKQGAGTTTLVVKDASGNPYATTEYAVTWAEGSIARTTATTIPNGGTVYVDYQYGTVAGGFTQVLGEALVLTGTVAKQLAFPAGGPDDGKWPKANRAKSRKGAESQADESGQYHRYGWAWLLNRRVMYNNQEVAGEVADVFVGPGFLSRQMTFTSAHKNTLANWSSVYRAYNTLGDIPSAGLGTVHVMPGNFPAHTEPYESPKPALVATWGKNLKKKAGSSTEGTLLVVGAGTDNGGAWPHTLIGEFGDSLADGTKFDLVLTTIRCVEHFQGGPITRNNPWNHELEPEPWVEINSVDAIKFGIKDGDYVDVITARGNSTTSQMALNKADADAAGFAKGFKARVGVGTSNTQRVAPGVVAIPWHWGERGLSKGSRANDLCIDAWDVNTMIPEYKACLCRIRKVTP